MNKPYAIGFKRIALGQLKKLDRSAAENVLRKLLQLARSVEVVQHTALTGQWKDSYKLRVGDYRVIYSLNDKEGLIIVEAFGHRREVYED